MSRFLNNANVELDALITASCGYWRAHYEPMEGQVLLVAHDSTDLNLSHLAGKLRLQDEDIGPTGSKASEMGYFVHPSLVIDAGTSFPLGYSQIKIWNRQFGADNRYARDYKKQPVEEKESYKWLQGVLQSQVQLQDLNARVIHLMDSDADMYELFALERLPKEDFIIRCSKERTIEVQGLSQGLPSYLEKVEWQSEFELEVPRGEKRKQRRAKMRLHYQAVQALRPKGKPKELADSVPMYLVYVRELDSSVPLGEEALEWVLWTSGAVENLQDALQIIDWYKKRWIIEELFSLLKTKGVALEQSQLASGIAFKKLTVLAMLAVLPILQLIKDRDNTYEQKAQLILLPQQQVFVQALLEMLQGKTPAQKNPHPPDSLAQLAWVVARLGGWNGYANAAKPGPKTMSRGWRIFGDRWQGWLLARGGNN